MQHQYRLVFLPIDEFSSEWEEMPQELFPSYADASRGG